VEVTDVCLKPNFFLLLLLLWKRQSLNAVSFKSGPAFFTQCFTIEKFISDEKLESVEA
jgi:hypothetical protein